MVGLNMRKIIWQHLLRKYRSDPGSEFQWWMKCIYASLFPLDFAAYKLSTSRGYQPYTDVWLINGVQYSGQMMRQLAKSDGKIFKVKRVGTVLKVEELSPGTIVPPTPPPPRSVTGY